MIYIPSVHVDLKYHTYKNKIFSNFNKIYTLLQSLFLNGDMLAIWRRTKQNASSGVIFCYINYLDKSDNNRYKEGL